MSKMESRFWEDRKLLELAAKAAGYSIDYEPAYLTFFRADIIGRPIWDPINNDGDALRLAVKLQLTVCNDHISSGFAYCLRGDEEFGGAETSGSGEVVSYDYAATRRAIVIAAAEIGNSMP